MKNIFIKNNFTKKFTILLLIAGCSLIFDAAAMKRKEIEREEEAPSSWESTEPKRAKFDFAALDRLPRDLKILQLIAIVKTSATANEAIKTLHNLALTSKVFHALINSNDVNKQLIAALARRFFHDNALMAADRLHTRASLHWSHSVLPESTKKMIIDVILNEFKKADSPDEVDLDFIIKTVKLYMNLVPSGSFNNEYAAIWLIRTISKLLNTYFLEQDGEYANATELAILLYPNGIEGSAIRNWIAYADNQIKDNSLSLIARIIDRRENLKHLAELTAQGVDITNDLTAPDPATFAVLKITELLRILIDAGADLNERDLETGDTIMHRFFSYPNINEVHSRIVTTPTGEVIVPILLIAENNQEIINLLEMLLQTGANPDIKNNKGETAIDAAHNLIENMKSNFVHPHLRLASHYQDKIAFINRLIELIRQWQAVTSFFAPEYR